MLISASLYKEVSSIRAKEHFGGGIIEEMTMKPFAAFSFLLVFIIAATQKLCFKAKVCVLTLIQNRYEGDKAYNFYTKHIAPEQDKAAGSARMCFVALAALNRNCSQRFNPRGVMKEARYMQLEFNKFLYHGGQEFKHLLSL